MFSGELTSDYRLSYLPIQKVITGELYFLEISSIKYHGFSSGKRKVFPTIGHGRGPGGCSQSYQQCGPVDDLAVVKSPSFAFCRAFLRSPQSRRKPTLQPSKVPMIV